MHADTRNLLEVMNIFITLIGMYAQYDGIIDVCMYPNYENVYIKYLHFFGTLNIPQNSWRKYEKKKTKLHSANFRFLVRAHKLYLYHYSFLSYFSSPLDHLTPNTPYPLLYISPKQLIYNHTLITCRHSICGGCGC